MGHYKSFSSDFYNFSVRYVFWWLLSHYFTEEEPEAEKDNMSDHRQKLVADLGPCPRIPFYWSFLRITSRNSKNVNLYGRINCPEFCILCC